MLYLVRLESCPGVAAGYLSPNGGRSPDMGGAVVFDKRKIAVIAALGQRLPCSIMEL